MSVEITLFRAQCDGGGRIGPVPSQPVSNHTATFTPPVDGIIRVYAIGAPATVAIGGIESSMPSDSIEYFGVVGGQEVVIS